MKTAESSTSRMGVAPSRAALMAACLSGLCVWVNGCGSFTAGSSNAKGVQLYQQAQYQAAIDSFQSATRQDSNNADACYNLGRVYHHLGTAGNDPETLARAEQYYNMALDRESNHVEAHRSLAVFLAEQGQKDRAFNLLEGWVTREPAMADPRIELARLHEEFGNKDAAKECLYEALSLDPENPRTAAALGHLREQSGEYAQALENYRRSLQYNRFQTGVASRVATLQGATAASAPVLAPPESGTWMVNSGAPNLR